MAKAVHRWLRCAAFVGVATLLLSLASTGASALDTSGGSSRPVTPSCNLAGRGSSSDCVRHMHLGASPHHTLVGPGKAFKLGVWLHPSLAGTHLQVAVQVRSLHVGHKAGRWVSTTVYSGLGAHFGDALGWRTVTVHAPKQKVSTRWRPGSHGRGQARAPRCRTSRPPPRPPNRL